MSDNETSQTQLRVETHEWFEGAINKDVPASSHDLLMREHGIIRQQDLERFQKFENFHQAEADNFYRASQLPKSVDRIDHLIKDARGKKIGIRLPIPALLTEKNPEIF